MHRVYTGKFGGIIMSKLIKLIFDTGAFQVLEEPTILTSGEIGIYYVNTEKLCPNSKELLAEFGDLPAEMIKGAVQCYENDEDFRYVIEALAEKAESYLQSYNPLRAIAISGGQRRDWIFSGPVAVKLDLPHVTLYKPKKGNPDRIEVMLPDRRLLPDTMFDKISSVHIADLMTKGSSAYTASEGMTIKQDALDEDGNILYGSPVKGDGWIPMQRRAGIEVNRMLNVVTRLQGGEENLLQAKVDAFSFVAINPGFITKANKADLLTGEKIDISLDYMQNPEFWSKEYIRNNGVDAFVKFFDPDGGKTDRAGKFVDTYNQVLEESGRIQELEEAVQKEYGRSLKGIIGGK